MGAEVLQIAACLTAIVAMVIAVVVTRWLIVAERTYPRDAFPVVPADKFRGVVLGIVVGLIWCVCDFALHRIWGRPAWDLYAWELRLALLAVIVISGRLTCAEIFRVLRCWRKGP